MRLESCVFLRAGDRSEVEFIASAMADHLWQSMRNTRQHFNQDLMAFLYTVGAEVVITRWHLYC